MPVIAPLATFPAGNERSVQSDGTAADVGGDTFVIAPKRKVAFHNGDVSSTTVTIATPGTAAGNDISEYQVAVPAGETVIAGPFPYEVYADATGSAALSYSSVTSLTVLVFD